MSEVSPPITDHRNGGISGVHAMTQRVPFIVAILAIRISTETGLLVPGGALLLRKDVTFIFFVR